jgi:hypothetical protein
MREHVTGYVLVTETNNMQLWVPDDMAADYILPAQQVISSDYIESVRQKPSIVFKHEFTELERAVYELES